MNRTFLSVLLTLCLTCLFRASYCQDTSALPGAEYGAYSGAGIAGNGAWQNLLNPAGIQNADSWQVGASYVSRFVLSELSSRNLVGSLPLGDNGTVGFTVHSFGYSAYLQNQFSAAYALSLSPKLRAGIQMNYYSVNIGEGFGRYTGLTANLGFQYDFTDNITAAVVIKNPNRAELSTKIQEYIQTLIQGGITCELAENLLVYADVSKDLDFDPWLSVGLDYAPLDSWHLRGGIASHSNSVSFGFGYQPEKWSIDLASLYHQSLGFSPMISFTYRNE